MPKVLKTIVAAVVTVIALGTVGLLVLRDLDRRPDYCASCHVTEQGVASWVQSDYLAYTHAVSGISCQRCHERNVLTLVREVTSTVLHGVQAPPPDFQFAGEDCARCHGDIDQVASITENLPRNPHSSPHEQQDCTECHKVHDASIDSCAACHEPTVLGPGWTAPQQSSALAP